MWSGWNLCFGDFLGARCLLIVPSAQSGVTGLCLRIRVRLDLSGKITVVDMEEKDWLVVFFFDIFFFVISKW